MLHAAKYHGHRGLILALAAALTCAGAGAIVTVTPSLASGPGTPIDVQATSNADGSITVGFVPTASEQTCTEFLITDNGQPVDLGQGCPYSYDDTSRLNGWVQTVQFTNLRLGDQYCFQVRGRDWNDGDPQAGDTSDLWSAQVCAYTAYPTFGGQGQTQPSPPPQKPGTPTLTIRGTRQLDVTITWSAGIRAGEFTTPNGAWYVVQRNENEMWLTISGTLLNPLLAPIPGSATMQYEDMPPPLPLDAQYGYSYRVCAGNDAGETCSDPVGTYQPFGVAGGSLTGANAAATPTPGPHAIGPLAHPVVPLH